MNYDIKDESLAAEGKLRIEWADRQMPVLTLIREQFEKEKPLEGLTVACCLHVTSETANLMRTLKAGGADVHLCASNPLSTQDSTASSLVKDYGISVYAIRGEDRDTFYKHINQVLDQEPDITMDDGGDLVSTLHSDRTELIDNVIAGTEETTTGVIRFRSMEREGVLRYPVIAVNDANTKHLFDNRYGTGQSSIDGVLRATNILLAGKTFVVGGYGYCGKGIAMRAEGMGANVIVIEVDPLRALEAVMDGYRVMPTSEAAKLGDVFVTATGCRDVLRKEHFEVMKDGAILANSGHFNVEIDIPALEDMATNKREVRPSVEEYTMKDGRKIHVLGEGRLVNLAAAEGHPASVMDMSFANQALTAEYLKDNSGNLERKVYSVPEEIDHRVASLKLKAMGIEMDELTEKQKEYLHSWTIGT
ncbi:MAG: adenosylhomocysteinase [Archaeoglobaceae archaeon]